MRKITWKEANSSNWYLFGTPGEKEFELTRKQIKVPDDTPVILLSAHDGDAVYPKNRKVPYVGIAVYLDEDAELMATFAYGKPIIATNWTRRDMVYHQGIYVHEGEQHVHQTNLITVRKETSPSPESEAAKEFLLGKNPSN